MQSLQAGPKLQQQEASNLLIPSCFQACLRSVVRLPSNRYLDGKNQMLYPEPRDVFPCDLIHSGEELLCFHCLQLGCGSAISPTPGKGSFAACFAACFGANLETDLC